MVSPKKTSSGLSQRALLVAVNISQWTGRRLDRKATDAVNDANKAESTAGAYHKRLLPGASELQSVQTIASQARKYYYENTLPWLADGTRIISSKNYLNFTAEMRKIKGQFETAVKDFSKAYPKLKTEAARALGDLYNSEEYPDSRDIGDKFSIEVSYLPIPDIKDFRVEVSEAEKRDFQRKMKAVESAAMRECWQRLATVVKTAADRLSSPDSIFRDSLIQNIQDVASILPTLAVSDDANLEATRLEVESIVSKLSPDTLRVNAGERTKAGKALADIEARMGAFMGAAK